MIFYFTTFLATLLLTSNPTYHSSPNCKPVGVDASNKDKELQHFTSRGPFFDPLGETEPKETLYTLEPQIKIVEHIP
jgi:hypothetical protein